MKTVLVVGGAGFIGSHVNKMLHQAGYKTLVLDNLSTGSQQAVLYGNFIKGDLADGDLLEQIFKKNSIDAVMHFAAHIDVGESIINPLKYYQNNVCNTLNLLKIILKFGPMPFIFSSSAAVYGIPEIPQLDESHPTHPINPYGETKLMVEKMLQGLGSAHPFKFCSLRYFNAAGGDPEEKLKNYKLKESNLIPLALRTLLNSEESLTINGLDYATPDGTCIRDYIHIWDLGAAHILAMEALFNGKESSIYNLGNGQGFSVKEVIKAIESVTKKKLKVKEGPRRPGDPPFLVAVADKAVKELKWKPQYPQLETMIQHAWAAMKDNKSF